MFQLCSLSRDIPLHGSELLHGLFGLFEVGCGLNVALFQSLALGLDMFHILCLITIKILKLLFHFCSLFLQLMQSALRIGQTMSGSVQLVFQLSF